jgi:hypothetical protein
LALSQIQILIHKYRVATILIGKSLKKIFFHIAFFTLSLKNVKFGTKTFCETLFWKEYLMCRVDL